MGGKASRTVCRIGIEEGGGGCATRGVFADRERNGWGRVAKVAVLVGGVACGPERGTGGRDLTGIHLFPSVDCTGWIRVKHGERGLLLCPTYVRIGLA